MHHVVVAAHADQWGRPRPESKPSVGVSLDEAVRVGGGSVVSGPVASSACAGPASEYVLRAPGGAHASPAQGQTQPVGILWCRSDLPRIGQSRDPSPAQHPHHSSDSGAARFGDSPAAGPVSERTEPALPHGPPAERRPPDRFHRGTLLGSAASRCDPEPKRCGDGVGRQDRGGRSARPTCLGVSAARLATPWSAAVAPNGQRYESDGRADACPESGTAGPILSGLSGHSGLYTRTEARLQCSR